MWTASIGRSWTRLGKGPDITISMSVFAENVRSPFRHSSLLSENRTYVQDTVRHILRPDQKTSIKSWLLVSSPYKSKEPKPKQNVNNETLGR